MNASVGHTSSQSNHRLFVGLPVAAKAASAIRDWAESAYAGQTVRLVEESQMHSTLMFFPRVVSEKRDWMASLIRKVEWESLDALTGETVLLGRGSLALELILPKDVTERLDDRLVRASYMVCDYGVIGYHDRLRAEALGQLALEQGEAQWEPRRRDHRHSRELSLHITFARYRKNDKEAILLHSMPPLAIQLSSVALYESHLGSAASKYEIIAEQSC